MFITMTKKYENPMLQIVSINKNDIITTSDFGSGTKNGNEACAPDRFSVFDPDDSWANAGY